MGRVSKAQAQENRQHVVATASRMFREKGTVVSIADLMKAVGLTHGAFYKQFASKEDLVDKAIAHAFEDPTAHSPVTLEEHTGEHEAARRTLIENYLSIWHRDHAGDGCPVSGFAADLGRDPDQAARSQQVYINGVRNRAARLATGDDDGMAQLCTMVGALVLARATRGNPLSEELLQAARTALAENGTGQSDRSNARIDREPAGPDGRR
ncbi:TetR/AcrR family transcriptional regulator [Streptomyces mirabilis]|uniref:TetR/AcrR family transcriptional regulator n=1 Tax=Streptomyces mirabilis TaxID=68239 RepID=UPI003647FEFF